MFKEKKLTRMYIEMKFNKARIESDVNMFLISYLEFIFNQEISLMFVK